ncbi:MAG: LysM peptidoglycan-binding domain-containing protein [Candidatus Obscuribacterales bacterium]|nr:LysM peptidoglycan-binding domain-containing protein [Candidatus Obscuribacterales bacterium]
MNFRPTDSALGPAGDAGAGGALSGAPGSELGGQSLNSQFSGLDVSKAHQFFQASGDGGAAVTKALSGFDISGLTSAPMPGVEASALMPMAPGADGGLVAGVLTGANEPISPLIQMILKMPGAMGLVNSLFEFLANFFLNPMSFFDIFNPTNFANHAAAAFQMGSEHIPVSLTMLPANAPIFGNLSGLAQPMFSSDLLSAKLNLSLGHSSPYGALAKNSLDPFQNGLQNNLNVGGEGSPYSAAFENAPGAAPVGQTPNGTLSGPNLTDPGSANHVAGNTRLFSDRVSSGGTFNTINLAAKSPVPTSSAASSIQGLTSASANQGINGASGMFQQPNSFLNNARFEGVPNSAYMKEGFSPNIGQDVGYSMTSPAANNMPMGEAAAAPVNYGPSGYVGSELGGASGAGNNMIAMEPSSFKPSLGGSDSQFKSAFPASGQQSSQLGGQSASSSTGLKAQQLSLDGANADAPQMVSDPSSSITRTGADASKTAGTASSHKAAESALHKASGHSAKHVSHRSESATSQPQQVEQVDGVTDGTQLAASDGAVSDGAAAQYTIHKGDSLWNIAKQHLGDGSKWQEIYQLNQTSIGQNPDLIYPGTTLNLPGGGAEIASNGSTTISSYVVKPGDNLWDISHELLGKGSKWGDLYQANQDIIGANPRLIHPGQELSIPGAADPSGSVASSTVDPSAVDPSAAAQPSTGGMTAAPQDIRTDGLSGSNVSSYGTQPDSYGAMPQYIPQAQAVPQAPMPPVQPAQGQMQQVSFVPETGYGPANAPAGFSPTLGDASKPLKVMASNPTPVANAPDAAIAAAPPADQLAASQASDAAATAANASASKSVVAASGFSSHLKSLFGKK